MKQFLNTFSFPHTSLENPEFGWSWLYTLMGSISGHLSKPFIYLVFITSRPSNSLILCISLEWTKSLMSTDFLFNSGYGKEEGRIKGVISIPRLQAEARSEILTQWSPTKLLLQMDSSATAYGSTISKKVAWRYGMYLFPTWVLPRALCTWVQCLEPLVRGDLAPLTIISYVCFQMKIRLNLNGTQAPMWTPKKLFPISPRLSLIILKPCVHLAIVYWITEFLKQIWLSGTWVPI